MDSVDRELLYQLDMNARLPISALAQDLGKSSDAVSYRLDKLSSGGVVFNSFCAVDLYRLGFLIYKTYFKLSAASALKSTLIERLNNHPKVYWLAEFYGSWDLCVVVAVRNPLEYLEFKDEITNDFSGLFRRLAILSSVDVQRYPKGYLLNKKSKPVHFGSMKNPYKLDELAADILLLLSKDARKPVSTIASELGTTASKVSYRISDMEDKGLITHYRLQVNYDELPITKYKILVSLTYFGPEFEKKFQDFCHSKPAITVYIRQIGRWSLEIELEVTSQKELHETIDELESNFGEFLLEVDYLMLRKDHYYRVPPVIKDFV